MNDDKSLGVAGAMAAGFVRSKLTPLIVLASLALGAFALVGLPREEEPQINVPMFDVFVPFPGASAREVEKRVVTVGERRLMEIPGVEYLYSTAQPGMAMFIVRFKVGTNPDEAMTRVYTKAFANLDELAPGAMQPLIKPRLIDDVPVLAVTFWSPSLSAMELRRRAAAARDEAARVSDVAETSITGGRRRQFSVQLDPDALARRRLTALDVLQRIQAANVRLPAGTEDSPGRAVVVETDALVRTVADLKNLVLGVSDGRPVRLEDVAKVTDGPDDADVSVVAARGPSPAGALGEAPSAPRDAVTLAVSKRRGANATTVTSAVLARLAAMRKDGRLEGVEWTVTRDYGQTAKRKSDELLDHMSLATVSVTLLIALVLGWREGLVVLVAIPVTLALTLLVYFLSGYTLNRITLFALIFSIGILVDDAIVVVENIHRHYSMKDGRPLTQVAVEAVAEVGNPTLLATWTVIAAILPMAFVRGLMGPYMRPIPVGSSMAMLFSVAVAFMVSPWAFTWLLEKFPPKSCTHDEGPGRLERLYRSAMERLLGHGPTRAVYFLAMAAMLAGAVGLVAFKAVIVKMLPFDDKDEFEVVLTLPEGSSLARTREAAGEIGTLLRGVPEVRAVTEYAGAAAPYNFNGLVRHYFLRTAQNQADILVDLAQRGTRARSSHEIATALRPPVHAIAERFGARVQVAEVPPGPPVLSTLVFELYGPDPGKRRELAARLMDLLRRSPGVTDVDTYVAAPQPLERLDVDRRKATLNGLPPVVLARTAALGLSGATAGLAHVSDEREPTEIRLRLPPALRQGLAGVERLPLLTANGTLVRLGQFVGLERRGVDESVYRKNQREVTYVIADVAGKRESPVYAILSLRGPIEELARSMGIDLTQYFARLPGDTDHYSLKWDGEWQITYEVFRDLGIAFALVLVLMYVLVVGWFRSFLVPLVIMAPIPLSLIGILPGHWAMHAFFTATSMIGFIAGAGIVVRNSILVVDFTELRLREGWSLKDAVIDAGAVRFRPMLLTAAAVVVGAGVILFDPIFQGLAVSLIAGEVVSTLLSVPTVPALYFMLKRRSPKAAEETT
ncbi:MAG: efflux RND transporter permease subunit [Elusimicrobia bacterium]|nr:efflux RND transporter permease subunit [Elusimicrobiota bacterium]